jgi:hypothetical protein
MELPWTEPIPVKQRRLELPDCQALYKIIDTVTGDLVYVGETENLRKRFIKHKIRRLRDPSLALSFVGLHAETLPHQRHELENDCIGCYFSKAKTAPRYQFSSSSGRGR